MQNISTSVGNFNKIAISRWDQGGAVSVQVRVLCGDIHTFTPAERASR